MAKLSAVRRRNNENISEYMNRIWYGIHRRISPTLRRKHHLDALVGPIGYWNLLQTYQFEFLKTMGLKRHNSLLDIGCGPLQAGVKLIDYLEPNRYTGIDLRQESIIAAFGQIIKHNLVHKNPTLIVSDSFGQEELTSQTFDYVWISQLLYHLAPEQIEALFLQVAAHMTPTSVLYGDIIDYKPQSDPGIYWQEFRFYRHQPDDLQCLAEKAGLHIDILGQLGNFGYPPALELSQNYMLEISTKVPQTQCVEDNLCSMSSKC